MKPNELMIGDWIKTPIDFENGAYVYDIDRISSINEYDAFSTSEFDMCGDVADLLPVELTAEILEKNGWQYGDWGDEYENDEYFTNEAIGFDLHINDEKEFEIRCVDAVNITLKFVHELQHALKLCGIDKEIEP